MRARDLHHAMTEREWQTFVVDLATTCGWWTHHHYDSRRSTPGWPDLVLLRPPEAIYAELKTDRGRVTRDQQHVLDMLARCGHETHLWRPRHQNDVIARLTRRPR